MKYLKKMVLVLCGVITISALWHTSTSYLPFNNSRFLLHETFSWTSNASMNTFWEKPPREFNISYGGLETSKNYSHEFAVKFNETSPMTNPFRAVPSRKPESQTVYNSNSATRRKGQTLYITSAIIKKGRLGNRMFKYASMLGMAVAQGRKMFIQPEADLQKTFKIRNVGYNGSYENWTLIKKCSLLTFDAKLMNLPRENVKLYAHLQSFLYFSNITDLVRQEFIFVDDIANAAADILSGVRTKGRSSLTVGVHVRRGDFLKFPNKSGFGVPQKTYFLKAFDWMRSGFPGRNVTFIVASDDLPWCKQNLAGSDVVLMPDASAPVHMAALASCNHVIISGGTFGWWCGWLAGGKVIYYKGYMAPGSDVGRLFKPNSYYPPTWIGIDN